MADRRRLERLCRYVIRPPVASGRLRFVDAETLVLSLKTHWADGTCQVVPGPPVFYGHACALSTQRRPAQRARRRLSHIEPRQSKRGTSPCHPILAAISLAGPACLTTYSLEVRLPPAHLNQKNPVRPSGQPTRKEQISKGRLPSRKEDWRQHYNPERPHSRLDYPVWKTFWRTKTSHPKWDRMVQTLYRLNEEYGVSDRL